ncbi:MAG: serine/threonine-protein kinase, partial [Acidobacteriota bacterium]
STGLAHRDLVPANVLVSDDGTAKIIDFGLAKQVSQGGLTQIGWSLGTPEYMSPEQIRGADDDDRTGDWWSLGIVLYEMVSGSQPFTGANLAGVLTAIQKHDPPSLTERRPEAPVALDRIVSRLLAKNPEDRYDSGEELLKDLGGRGEPLPSTPADAAPSAPSAESRAPATSPSATDAELAGSAGGSRTWLWVVIALLALVVVVWLLLAGSAGGALQDVGQSDLASLVGAEVSSTSAAASNGPGLAAA